MKSNAPWSVKGIEKDAREAAKEAARREGMTVGEWLSHVIVTAGDPEASHGEIEGLKLADLVTAIEHLNKRILSTEGRSLSALDELARNFGGVVDRVQRLERSRSVGGETPADIEERLSRIEDKLNDRQKIDTLKALEKAIGQVALQFDAAQRNQAQRVESTERQLQELASRIDSALDGPGSAGAIDYLKDTIDGLAARISRAERMASEAARQKAAAPEAAPDSEFVERTGARLRVLGDEIKRGGDQMRALEGTIRKLSDQIDAAERRSSEGVQKVAETISDLRVQLAQSDGEPIARQEVEAAVADLHRKTEERFEGLQQTFEKIIARIESEPVARARTASDLSAGFDGDDAESDYDARSEEQREDAFEFEDAQLGSAAVEDLAAELPSARSTSEEDIDGIDAILAELDTFSAPPSDLEETPATRAEAASVESDAIFGDLDADESAETPGKGNFLAEARRAAKEAAAKEAAERAAAESGLPQRRKLTPKQRAILAAKIRRKRLAEQGLPIEHPSPDQAPLEPPLSAPEPAVATETKRSLLASLASAVYALRPAKASMPPSESATDGNPNIAKSAVSTTAALKTKPVTIALGAAVVLAGVAVFFLVKDLMFGGAPKEAPRTIGQTTQPEAAPTAPQLKDEVVPPPPATLTQPRTLYLDAVAKLKVATSDSETRAALASLEQAAALGHPPAQLQLGELYKLGQGVPQDLAQARAWYERAANGGNVLAMHRIGVMAARGQGGVSDQAAAIAWFEKAAGLNLMDSQYNLGAIFHPGADGGALGNQNAAKAYYWYLLAARNGDEQAASLASGLATGLSAAVRSEMDAAVASFAPGTPDPDANEIAAAS